MTMMQLLVIILAAGAAVTMAGIITVALRRPTDRGPVSARELAEAAARSPVAVATKVMEEPPAGPVPTVVEEPPAPPPRDRSAVRIEVDPATYGMTRRRFLNRALFAAFGVFLLQFALSSLAFLWPKLEGGFGAKVKVGKVEDIKAALFDGSTVVPYHDNTSQAWIVPFPLDELPGSSYENLPNVLVGGEEDGIALFALWHRCPHLGCRVPECIPSQGFECPCHGSKFNIHGEYEAGPAPRNMDRFEVTVDGDGNLVVDTGTVVQTPRSKHKTAEYPQGPFCV